jgi:hypothetical protein
MLLEFSTKSGLGCMFVNLKGDERYWNRKGGTGVKLTTSSLYRPIMRNYAERVLRFAISD